MFLATLPDGAVKTHQPYRALKVHLLKRLRHAQTAQQAYARAIGLTEDAAMREFLVQQLGP